MRHWRYNPNLCVEVRGKHRLIDEDLMKGVMRFTLNCDLLFDDFEQRYCQHICFVPQHFVLTATFEDAYHYPESTHCLCLIAKPKKHPFRSLSRLASDHTTTTR